MNPINYLDGVDVIYWININRATERRKKMEKILKDPLFDGIKNVRINGLDAKYKNPREKFILEKIKDLNDYNRIITDNEYAILYSHLESIRAFSETNYKNALIFEDDLSLKYKKYWKKSIQQIINDAPSDWEIIKLSQNSGKLFTKLYTLWDSIEVFNPKHIRTDKTKWKSTSIEADWLAHGYLISNKAAKKLIHSIYRHKKYALSNKFIHVSDGFIFQSLTTYTYKYPYFTYDDNHISYSTNTNTKNKIRTFRNQIIDTMYKKTRKL
jgi:GR25 family glycosyltransferase involved in LPS biosynthesis